MLLYRSGLIRPYQESITQAIRVRSSDTNRLLQIPTQSASRVLLDRSGLIGPFQALYKSCAAAQVRVDKAISSLVRVVCCSTGQGR